MSHEINLVGEDQHFSNSELIRKYQRASYIIRVTIRVKVGPVVGDVCILEHSVCLLRVPVNKF